MSKNEVKELLNSIPLEEGVLEAPNVDSLVRQLMSDSIFPVKIRPCDKMDERLERLKSLRSQVSMSTVKVNEDILKVLPMQKNKQMARKSILLTILTILILSIVGCAVYRIFVPWPSSWIESF